MAIKQPPGQWGSLGSVYKTTFTLLASLILHACGEAELTGKSKKRSTNAINGQNSGPGEFGSDDPLQQYGTTADGKPCLKLTADQPGRTPNQNPGQNPGQNPSQSPGKEKNPPTTPPPSKPPANTGKEPGPVPPCTPGPKGQGAFDGTKGKYPADVDVNVDIGKTGYGPQGPGTPNQPCNGPLCIFVGVGKGGNYCKGPQCPPPPGPGEPPPPPPPPPPACPQGKGGAYQGKIWNKWSQWKKGC